MNVVGEGHNLPHVGVEVHQVHLIDGAQQRMNKVVRGALLDGEIFMHAAAGVNGQDDFERQLGLALEDSDLLRMSVFEE